jgi:hypothetical protein
MMSSKNTQYSLPSICHKFLDEHVKVKSLNLPRLVNAWTLSCVVTVLLKVRGVKGILHTEFIQLSH